ncbi:hypothetical protein TNIN_105041 [Trichonephila inaurata madagascariensis]|uniref:ATP-dependent DNA helicase n=1 Tax=Trichonephila inaurata madagascariensis TaxID=2747483 RepID=A0A8X7BP88_9ARAC|nr:hypothetical protein TNIN_105041 [Trichonephila inaurata madagascariensis]
MPIGKNQKIAIAVASSGISVTLLTDGYIAHSISKLSLNLAFVDSSICKFSKNSSRGRMLRKEKLLKIGDGCLDADSEGDILHSREFCNLAENDVDLNAQVYPSLQ